MALVQTTGIEVVAIYVTDLERAKAFYCDTLGCVESEEMPPGILLKIGEQSIYLEGGRAPKSCEPGKHTEVAPCFGTASIKTAFEALEKEGVTILTPYKEFGPTFAMFQIADPDGNVIEFAGAP